MGIYATDSINLSKAERKVQKQQEEVKKKQEELKKQRELEQAAQALVDGISGTEFDGRYNVKAMRKEVDKDLEKQLKAFKQDYKNGKISKEEYEAKKDLYDAADDYLKSDWQKQKKSNVKAVVTSEVAAYASTLSSTNIGDIAGTVKDDIEQDYKNGDLSKEQRNAYKKGAKIGTYAGRFFTGKEKEARGMFKSQAHRNNVELTKEEGPKFDAESQALLNLAGLTADDVYKIGDANGGAADGTINYSKKKKQEGEMDAILAEFNKNKAGVVFDKKQTNKIMEQAGYTVEKKIDAGKTLTDAARGLLIGAPFSVVHIKQHAAVDPSAAAQGVIVDATQTIDASGVVPVITTAAKTVQSMLGQAGRVESRALPTNVPDGISTYKDYCKYLDSHSTRQGADIGKNLARFFKNADGTLNIEKMNKAFSTAAGTDGSTTTPLNYDEAKGLLLKLVSGKEEPVAEQPKEVKKQPPAAPVKENCTVVVEKYEEVINDTDCYKVKDRENWDVIVRGLYKPKTEADVKEIRTALKQAYLDLMQTHEDPEIRKKWKDVKVTDGFFAEVGEELCLPKVMQTASNNKYQLDINGQVAKGTLKKDANGNLDKNYGKTFSINGIGVPSKFLSRTQKANVNACDTPIAKGVTTEEASRIANQFLEDNQDKKNITIIGL